MGILFPTDLQTPPLARAYSLLGRFPAGTILVSVTSVRRHTGLVVLRDSSDLSFGTRARTSAVVDRATPLSLETFGLRDVLRATHKENVAMAKKEAKTLDELFHDTLKDIYFAEKKILSTLPKMEKAAQDPSLKRAFAKHKTETEGHVARLEEVFAAIDKKPQAKTCDAIVGITDEGAEIMKEYKGSPALDAGLLAAAQAVEHYEISRYGTLRTWANELGLSDAAGLLDQTLDEEKKTDATLTEIAESVVNQEAEAA